MTHSHRKFGVAVFIATLLVFAIPCSSGGLSAPVPADDATETTVATRAENEASADAISRGDTVVAYYFHGTQRCVTCRKLEAYSEEALISGFRQEIADSTLLWRTVDYDEKQNAHFIKDYKLFTKAVILSRIRDGKEIAWTNLDKIWQLVRDKEAFISYVQKETRAFLQGDDSDE